jgi:excinuclease ABC subunit A
VVDSNGFVTVRGALQNNLRGFDVQIPRNAFVVFTGISGSGKSSLAFGTIYAEAQRRYFESIAPYARRLIAQLPAPRVTDIEGLPPAVALQQRRAEPTARSSVGTVTRLSNSLRLLFSRAGNYPNDGPQRLDSDAFSPNSLSGMCPACHGIGVVHTVTEKSLVPDDSLSIREKAIAAWPGAWQGKNYRDILAVLGYDVDKPWRELAEKDRQWILFTEEKPVVTVHAEREAHRIQRPYQGTYMSAAAYVRHTFATTNSATLRKRAARFMEASRCPECGGKRLKKDSLAVTIAGRNIADLTHLPLSQLSQVLEPVSGGGSEVARMLAGDLIERIGLVKSLGLDYLSLDRATPTLSAGELQRLRLVSQLKSGLFGVVYVLDEPSAGLHPADAESLLVMLRRLQAIGNSLFVVEHDMEIVKQAEWIVDMGPGAGNDGGELLYSGSIDGLAKCEQSITRDYLFGSANLERRKPRKSAGTIVLRGATKHNLKGLDVEFPLEVITVVTGVSGSGKSTLVSQVLADAIQDALQIARKKSESESEEGSDEDLEEEDASLELDEVNVAAVEGLDTINRFVVVDQKPIGRTPRSNLATYTGLFDHVRKLFASTEEAKTRNFKASRFSFNVEGGRCPTCQGEGFLSVELVFLPSVYAPCTACGGTRYNEETLAVTYNSLNIAQVLEMTVDSAQEFFQDVTTAARILTTLSNVGLGYLTLGQPATELSGGEAQRIKLAAELASGGRDSKSSKTLYVLDEPTTGLHPHDTKKLMDLLHALVNAGQTVIIVEHDMDVVSNADWIIELGPGAGENGGQLIGKGTPEQFSALNTTTAKYLRRHMER